MENKIFIGGFLSLFLSVLLVQSDKSLSLAYITAIVGFILILIALFLPWLRRKYILPDHTPELRSKAKHEYSDKYR